MKHRDKILALLLGVMLGISLLTVSVLAAVSAGETVVETPEVLASGGETVRPTTSPPASLTDIPYDAVLDLDGDNRVNANDLKALMTGLVDGTLSEGVGDCNGDGVTDVLDIVHLMRRLAAAENTEISGEE